MAGVHECGCNDVNIDPLIAVDSKCGKNVKDVRKFQALISFVGLV